MRLLKRKKYMWQTYFLRILLDTYAFLYYNYYKEYFILKQYYILATSAVTVNAQYVYENTANLS